MVGDLIGRTEPLAWLMRHLGAIEEGPGGAVVITGDAGVGKSALVAEFLRRAPQSNHVVVPGVEAEAAIPFGVVQRVVLRRSDLLWEIPSAQAAAIRIACGLAEGSPVAPALVGLGLLSMLSRLGEPAACLVWIDDAQWVDHESLRALAFAARRLGADRVGMVFTVRGSVDSVPELGGLPELVLSGLAAGDAGRLLARGAGAAIDSGVQAQIIAETGGNPLALIELGGEMSDAQLQGTRSVLGPVPLGRRLEEHYSKEVARFSDATQWWLLLIAAEPEASLVENAARHLGSTVMDLELAEVDGLVILVGGRFMMRHPLVRSAVYGAASIARRQRAHNALADAAEDASDHERGTWHRSLSTSVPDAPLAAALDRLAASAAQRGGFSTRATLLLRAAELSTTPAARSERIVRAAEAAFAAGALTQAHALIDEVAAHEADDAVVGRALTVRAGLAWDLGQPLAARRRWRDLAVAARLLFDSDADAARNALVVGLETLLDASARDPADIQAADDFAATALALLGARTDHVAVDQTVVAIATLVRSGLSTAAPQLRAAVDLLLEPGTPDDDVLACRALGLHAASVLWDASARRRLGDRVENIAWSRGAVEPLVGVLIARLYYDLEQGHLPAALERHPQIGNVLSTMNAPRELIEMVDGSPLVMAWRGESAKVLEALPGALAVCHHRGAGISAAIWRHAAMLGLMAERRYAEGWALGRDLVQEDPTRSFLKYLPDLIECSAREDGPTAIALLERLESVAGATNSAWVEGLLHRSRAVLDDAAAPEAFTRALELLAAVDAPGDLARTRLVYGEWLRRRRRRPAALAQLRAAHADFTRLGARGWQERARGELAALGEAPAVSPSPDHGLTPQEEVVARLAADGATNVQIAARLFLSSNTVDYHLRKVFQKLGISSRRHLRGALDDSRTTS